MKKLPILLVLAVLALPAAAVAKDRPHPGHHAKASTTTTYKNAAKACKAERAANPALFRARYHQNGRGIGKCVSAKRHHHQGGAGTVTLTLNENGTGMIDSAGAPGCQFTTAGCTLTAHGAVTGFPIAAGTFVSTFTVHWNDATSNGQGGYCAPADGTVTLTDTATGSTISKTETGQLCEVGATGPNVAHTFTGTYAVTGGTGLFAGATGSGTAGFQQPASSSSVTGTESGTVVLPA